MKKINRNMGNLIATAICFICLIISMFNNHLVGTIGFGFMFVGLNTAK